jgi:two-component system, OmpR family, sensor kinase
VIRRVPRPWRRWTLRTRLVVAIALLAGFALIFADAVSLIQLRSSLLGGVDRDLTQGARSIARTPAGREFDAPVRRAFNPGPDVRVTFYTSSGTVDRTTGDTAGPGPALDPYAGLSARADGIPFTVDDLGGGDPWRVVVNHRASSAGGLVVVAVSLRQLDSTQRTLLGIDGAVLVLMLLLLGLAAASVVRLGLAPLTGMETTAQQIAAGDLSRRVENVDPHTEAGRLGLAFNAMLTRIESALAARTASERRLRQFLADASHELRTPLTSIQGFAELYRRGGTPPGPALDEAMARIEAEADRMALLVTDLMLLARLDEERPLDRHPVDLLSIAVDAVRDAHARVPGRAVILDCDDPLTGAGPVTVAGDEARLRQVVTNLVANALQHTPPETRITVRVGRTTGDDAGPPTAVVGTGPAPGTPTGLLEVTDTGAGLSTDQAERVFERLYRADASRQRASGGAGLGLAIVAAIVVAHGGRVELRTRPGAGATFRVLLPELPDQAPARWDGAPRVTGEQNLGTVDAWPLAPPARGTK